MAYNLNINKTKNLNNSSTDLQGKDVQYKQSNINTSCTDINGKFDIQTIISEKDLDDARAHITTTQNNLKILNYYFPSLKKTFFPFFLPIIELNS